MQIFDDWTEVTITGIKVLQLRTDGEVLAVAQDARPSDAQDALVLKDGWTGRISAPQGRTAKIWLRQHTNTSRADLSIGGWTDTAPLPVAAQNVTSKFREAFEDYDTAAVWAQALAPGDIVQVDGNACAASYLVISKDPLSVGVTTVETRSTFSMPFEASLGLHMSQRTLGQEFAVEFVSVDDPLQSPNDVAIASIQQATTMLTITTSAPHGLRPGMRFGVRDVADSRFNYPALVVASTPSPTQITATAGPGGTIPSVTAGPFASGFVFLRSALGYAPDGTSMIFESANAAQAAIYARSQAGDVLPSGVAAGNHTIAVGSSASVAAISAANTYAWQPTSEFRLVAMVDGIQWMDAGIDAVTSLNHRLRRTQVVPAHDAAYKLRFRATNNASLTRPVAQIVSVVKTGTTTATVTTDVPHGLTTGDVIVAYGPRDTTNFASLTAATAVASVIDATRFTVIWGSAVTATSYGGYVARVNGGNLMSALGAIGQIAQNISRTANIVALVGHTTWSGFSIGDYVNLIGIRDAVSGASLGLDGPYRVRDVQTTIVYLEPIGTAPTGADVASVNCGGAVIKRTDLRVSFARILDFERQRVELTPRPAADGMAAQPVAIVGTPGVNATLQASTNLAADVGVQMVAARGTALSVARLVSAAASTNATLVKASAGKIAKIVGYNASAAVVYLKLYNKASAPTVGTDTPLVTLPLKPSSDFAFDLDALGLTFSTGIAYALTSGSADTNTTALVAGDVVGLNVFYV